MNVQYRLVELATEKEKKRVWNIYRTLSFERLQVLRKSIVLTVFSSFHPLNVSNIFIFFIIRVLDSRFWMILKSLSMSFTYYLRAVLRLIPLNEENMNGLYSRGGGGGESIRGAIGRRYVNYDCPKIFAPCGDIEPIRIMDCGQWIVRSLLPHLVSFQKSVYFHVWHFFLS